MSTIASTTPSSAAETLSGTAATIATSGRTNATTPISTAAITSGARRALPSRRVMPTESRRETLPSTIPTSAPPACEAPCITNARPEEEWARSGRPCSVAATMPEAIVLKAASVPASANVISTPAPMSGLPQGRIFGATSPPLRFVSGTPASANWTAVPMSRPASRL